MAASPESTPLGRNVLAFLLVMFLLTLASGSMYWLADHDTHVALVGPFFNYDVLSEAHGRYMANFSRVRTHLLPGFVFLGIAALQLRPQFRRASISRHRWLGRVAFAAALVSAYGIHLICAIAFSASEVAAAYVFGAFFTFAVLRSWSAVRAGDVPTHREWAIRSVFLGSSVGIIRVVYGLWVLLGFDKPSFSMPEREERFGAIFWFSMVLGALMSELYINATRPPAEPAGAKDGKKGQ